MKLITIIGILISFNLYAGETSRVGNGGGVLFCKDRMPLLLDIYESQYNELHTFSYFNSLEDSEAKNILETRVKLFLPRVSVLLSDLKTFFDVKKQLISNVEFKIPDDFRNLYYEQSCSLHVVAVQRLPLLPFDKIFFINEDLWSKLNKAKYSLIDHEILYLLAILNGAKNSLKVRQFLAFLMSDQFDESSIEYRLNQFTKSILEGSFAIDEDIILKNLCSKLTRYRFTCDDY